MRSENEPINSNHIVWLFFNQLYVVYVHLQKKAKTALFYYGKKFRAKAQYTVKTNKNIAIILYLPDDVLGPPI